jgi:cold shock CspA family protein
MARIHGYVKFFNDIERYGMICMMDASVDVFVHMNDLRPLKETGMPRRLYTGEYVSFEIEEAGPEHSCPKARNVKGAFDGPLLMEHGDLSFIKYSRAYLTKSSPVENGGSTEADQKLLAEEGDYSA